MENTEDGKKLLQMVELIAVPQIKQFVYSYLENRTPDYFWHVPASSSGKYHPESSLGEGGLVRHTISATIMLRDMMKLEYFTGRFTEIERSQMLAAIIIHDTFKQGLPGAGHHTVNDHADIACAQINDFLGMEKTVIGRLVETHMGEWGKEKPQTPMEALVHTADYYASRRYINILL